MKKLGLFALPLLLLLSCQDSDGPGPGDTFLKYYGEAGLQSGDGIVHISSSGESVIYGTQIGAASNQSDLFLLKVDENGNELITTTYDLTDTASYGSVSLFNDLSGSLRLSGDRLYYVGTSQSVEFSVLAWAIFHLDLSLLQQGWISVCRDESGGECVTPGNVTGADLVIDDGELIFLGTSNVLTEGDPLIANGGLDQQIYVARVNPSDPDSVLVERTRGFAGTDEALYIDRFSPDDIVVIGTTQRSVGTEGTNLLVMALNDILIPRGNEEVTLTVGAESDFNEIPRDVFKRSNGYVITGVSSKGSNAFPFFANVSYNSSGSVVVDQIDTLGVVESVANNGSGRGITLAPNGNYFIVGSMPTSEKGGEIMILQTDQGGSSLPGMQRGYGLSSGNDLGNDVVAAQDGSMLILSTVDFGSGNTLLGLMKLNANGDLMR